MAGTAWSSLSEFKTEPVQWLWDARIPLGKITLLEGLPGIGKSTLALDLAARVTRGIEMPLEDAAVVPASDVAVFSGDDDLADTVRPRLEAAGADLSRVRPILPEVGIPELRALGPALII